MNFIVASSTDIGNTKNTNQDSHIVRVYDTNQGKIVFAVLCDGMGGLSKGEVASTSVVHAFCKWADDRLPVLCANRIMDCDISNEWTNIIVQYNEKIKTYGKRCGASMGTTVTVMMCTSERYYIVNVGDTRAYELKDSVRLLTKDQTVVAREVELGHITAAEAEHDARRSILLQCVGASESVYPDLFFGETQLNAVYMICSDGFRHEISPYEIYGYLNPDVMTDADGMRRNIDALINLNKERMERDNITAIAIRTF